MDINIDFIGKLVAPILTAIVGLIVKRYFEARPKLITYLIHASAIPLGDDVVRVPVFLLDLLLNLG